MKTKLFQILGIAAIATIGMSSCDTDACADVECGANGTCLEGDCVCDLGYTGEACDEELRATFAGIGTINMSGTAVCPVTGNGTIPATPTTFGTSSAINKITMNFGGSLLLTCTVTSVNAFTVDSQTVNGYNYTGSGSLTGTNLSVTLNEEETGVETCVYTLTGTI